MFCKHCGNRMALVYQRRPSGFVSHTYKCTTYYKKLISYRNKDYCPRPNTLLHRRIKKIVENELRELTKNINKDEFLEKLISKIKSNTKEKDVSLKINKLEIRKDKLYQLTKKVYDDTLNGIKGVEE